jgi:hypothetical protein
LKFKLWNLLAMMFFCRCKRTYMAPYRLFREETKIKEEREG